MIDYTERIRDRAKIVGVEITPDQLDKYNLYVNERVFAGIEDIDALDFVYFDLVKYRNALTNG